MTMSSPVRKNIFLIPYWIKTILERHQQPLTTVLDLNGLSALVSSEDLAVIALLNQQAETYLNLPIQDEAILGNWYTQSGYGHHVAPLLPLVKETLENRLLSAETLEDRYPNAFEIRDLDDATLLVIVYPGHFGGPETLNHQHQLARALLKLFHAYEGYDHMAQKALFQRYLSQL